MKLATNKWNISEVGKNKPALYYGFKTKKKHKHLQIIGIKPTNLKLKILNTNIIKPGSDNHTKTLLTIRR